jgi:hypothetical protein
MSYFCFNYNSLARDVKDNNRTYSVFFMRAIVIVPGTSQG